MKTLPGMLLVLLARGALAAPSLSVGVDAGAPGTTVMVPVSYASDTNAVSLQFDLLYATNYIASGQPVGGSALADHLIGTSEPTGGMRRVLIFSFSNTPFTNGVLVYVPFTIASNAFDHDESLSLSNVIVVSAAAEAIPLGPVLDGRLTVSPPPSLSPVAVTGDGVVHLRLAGTTGRSYALEAASDFDASQWSALATNVAAGGTLDFDDAPAGGITRRFYRARLEP